MATHLITHRNRKISITLPDDCIRDFRDEQIMYVSCDLFRGVPFRTAEQVLHRIRYMWEKWGFISQHEEGIPFREFCVCEYGEGVVKVEFDGSSYADERGLRERLLHWVKEEADKAYTAWAKQSKKRNDPPVDGWLAMDVSGAWDWFEYKPQLHSACWMSLKPFGVAIQTGHKTTATRVLPGWRDSLVRYKAPEISKKKQLEAAQLYDTKQMCAEEDKAFIGEIKSRIVQETRRKELVALITSEHEQVVNWNSVRGNWYAMDFNGQWHCFEEKPEAGQYVWQKPVDNSMSHGHVTTSPLVLISWKETLLQRPGLANEAEFVPEPPLNDLIAREQKAAFDDLKAEGYYFMDMKGEWFCSETEPFVDQVPCKDFYADSGMRETWLYPELCSELKSTHVTTHQHVLKAWRGTLIHHTKMAPVQTIAPLVDLTRHVKEAQATYRRMFAEDPERLVVNQDYYERIMAAIEKYGHVSAVMIFDGLEVVCRPGMAVFQMQVEGTQGGSHFPETISFANLLMDWDSRPKTGPMLPVAGRKQVLPANEDSTTE